MYAGKLECIFCEMGDSVDSEQHYLTCFKVREQLNPLGPGTEISKIKYGDIYGTLEQQMAFLKVWKEIDSLRDKIA